jgi:outer membrane protein OmpA-like peptidoglycan-associated protein
MKKQIMILLVMVGLCFSVSPAGAASDVKGSKDPTLFTRMPGWYINQYEENEFGSYEFIGTNGQKTTMEGHKLIISYTWSGTGKKPSSLQVIRNYQNAIKKISGTVLYEKGDDFTTMKLVKDGRETWAELSSEVDAGWGGYILTIIEKGAMNQNVVADAAAMKAGIKTEGHIAVYGINFDTNKAEIKPESDAAIAEIAKLLKQDATLKLHVVGHTDNVGGLDTNMKLSHARAEAVKAVLVSKHGIAASRLSSFGAGPYCPVSTNLIEEGRAKNRRVELVQQ